MINVCIVEDEPQEARRLTEALDEFGREQSIGFAEHCFTSAEDMLRQYSPGRFDIIFLDVMLPGMNGMDAARELRRRDDRDVLIFVTNEHGLAVEGYSVNALDYMVKPVAKYAFFATMERAMRHLGRNSSTRIRVDTADGPRFLDAAGITYVEVIDHTLTYHTGDEKLREWGSLRKAERVLGQYGFERCGSSYLVNLRFVTALSGEELTVGGQQIKLTRGRRKQFLQRLNDFYAL